MLNIRHLYGRLVPANLSWSLCVKSEIKLVSLLLRVVPLVFGRLSSSVVKVLWGYVKNVRRIYKASGPKGLALYLKTCSVLLQQVAGGRKLGHPWQIGCNVARTRKGLPRLVNPQHRRLILAGDPVVIRFWLTLFGLYREIEFKGALKLSTITKPGKDISKFRSDVWAPWIGKFYAKAELHSGMSWKPNMRKAFRPDDIPFIRKSSPNSGGLPSVSALAVDVLLFCSDLEMLSTAKRWLALVNGTDLLHALRPLEGVIIKKAVLYCEELCSKWEAGDRSCQKLFEAKGVRVSHGSFWTLDGTPFHPIPFYKSMVWETLVFGKLGFKEEPGKIRVFAMATIIVQTLMYPLHKWIFQRLRAIATDGTFNQTAPLVRLIKMFDKKDHFVASYDLSAATDRLPLLLQQDLLVPLLGVEGVHLWANLLVGRPYQLPKVAKSYNLGFNAVYYEVGQPMGAYSSWAMLALTHHAIVQLAANNVYPKLSGWFDLYAVLGDDIVIADKAVAAEYLRIMETVGVEIGLHKSMISSTSSMEFAKRTYVRGVECSPLSLAECMVALCNLGALDQLVRKCALFINIRIASVARFAGFGYKNLARLPVVLGLNNRLSGLIGYLCRPGGVWPLPVREWLSTAGAGYVSDMTDADNWATAQSLWSRLVRSMIERNVQFERGLYAAETVRYSDAERRVTKTVKVGNKKRTVSEMKPVFGPTARETLGFDSNCQDWNAFFTEWISYPFTERLRETFTEIDNTLRVLRPDRQPQWAVLEDVWNLVFEADEGQSALPIKVEYFD